MVKSSNKNPQAGNAIPSSSKVSGDSGDDDLSYLSFWKIVIEGAVQGIQPLAAFVTVKEGVREYTLEYYWFFDALNIIDGASSKMNIGINPSSPLRQPFKDLVDESQRGFVEDWRSIPFDKPIARQGRDGYIDFVNKVFQLLTLIYNGQNFKRKVTEILGKADGVVEKRQKKLDEHKDQGNNNRKRKNHEEIRNLWEQAIASLRATIEEHKNKLKLNTKNRNVK